MTQHERNQMAAFQATGLSLHGWTFAKAMANHLIRISIDCAAKHQERKAAATGRVADQMELGGMTK